MAEDKQQDRENRDRVVEEKRIPLTDSDNTIQEKKDYVPLSLETPDVTPPPPPPPKEDTSEK